MSGLPRWRGVRAVVLDVDGTVVDSADGIVAGFGEALRAVDVEPPDDATLRADLGPPLVTLLPALGAPPDRLAEALAAYRSYYLRDGLRRSTPYAGMAEVLAALSGHVVLGTATAKRTDTARATLDLHGLARFFDVVNGLDDEHPSKAETLATTLDLLGGIDPAQAVMVGDRHSDITAGQAVGTRTVGVLWGYGSRAELHAAGPDVLLARPVQLLELLNLASGRDRSVPVSHPP